MPNRVKIASLYYNTFAGVATAELVVFIVAPLVVLTTMIIFIEQLVRTNLRSFPSLYRMKIVIILATSPVCPCLLIKSKSKTKGKYSYLNQHYRWFHHVKLKNCFLNINHGNLIKCHTLGISI